MRGPILLLAVLGSALVLGVGSAQATPGALDPGFGSGGIVTTPVGYSDVANALAVQSDGKVVAAGLDVVDGSHSRFALTRYNPDGTLDPAFGSGGIVTTPIGLYGQADAVALQPDGKIVVAGSSRLDDVSASHFAVARYNSDGSLDPGFGSGGIVTTPIGVEDFAHALALQPDGKIVVAGRSYDGSQPRFALTRYTPDGTLDPDFGAGGIVTTAVESYDEAYALVLQPDGKIVAAGSSYNGVFHFALVRYRPSGELDPGFGVGGIVTTPIQSGGDAYALALQPDGKLVAAGVSSDGSQPSFALARYDSAGSLDRDFGSDGIVTSVIGSGAVAYGIALQPDGKITAAGTSTGEQFQFTVARYGTNGSLDSGFGSDGIVLTAIGSQDEIHGVALQPDGKIVAAGKTFDGSVAHFALARYLGSTLIVAKAGSGSGTVTSTPSGIDCGTICSAPFGAVPVSLTPTAAPGSSFAGWSGDCSGTGSCTLQLSADRNVTATFESDKTLTVSKTGNGVGTVSSSPAGIDCGVSCTHAFVHGASVRLDATPVRGSRFAGWSGDCTGTGSCTLQLSADRSVTADFEPLCLVPKLRGRTLTQATKALRRAHCALGKVRHVYAAKVKQGRVVAQKPRPGKLLPRGARVSITLSKGKKR